MLVVFFILWFTSLAKDSGHAGSLFYLMVSSLAKDSGHAGIFFNLMVYFLSKGFRACW